MLALGETAILPGLLIVLVLFPATVLTFVASLLGKRNIAMVACSVASTIFGAWGIVDGLNTVMQDWKVPDSWPPSGNFVLSFLFCAFLLLAGGVSLFKMYLGLKKGRAATKPLTKAPQTMSDNT
jgi:hypothetical protein